MAPCASEGMSERGRIARVGGSVVIGRGCRWRSLPTRKVASRPSARRGTTRTRPTFETKPIARCQKPDDRLRPTSNARKPAHRCSADEGNIVLGVAQSPRIADMSPPKRMGALSSRVKARAATESWCVIAPQPVGLHPGAGPLLAQALVLLSSGGRFRLLEQCQALHSEPVA